MKKFLTIIYLLIFSGTLLQTYCQWIPHIIDPNLPAATIIDVADIDGDGDLDIAANGSPYVRWYQNNSATNEWTIHNIDNTLEGACGISIVDIDGDSLLDVVAAGYFSNQVRWYKNEGGNPIKWHKYIIDANYHGAEFLVVGDIDGDDDPDVIATGSFGHQLAWFENNLPDTTWTRHILDDNIPGAMNCDVGDIDGDGDLDVVATGTDVDDVRWYKNNLPSAFDRGRNIDDNLSGAFGVRITDIDGDGITDVLVTGLTANKLVCYKTENAGQTWTPYIIDADLTGARVGNVADIEGDGKLDLVATAYEGDYVVLYENQHQNWLRNKIDTHLDGANWVCTADINGDSLLDVLVTGRIAWVLMLYEQTPLWVKTVEVLPKYLIPDGDTLFIKVHIINEENHSLSVYTKIDGETVPFSDSLLLYDDGLHFDENPNDNIWGNAIWLSGLQEDIYRGDIYLQDISEDSLYKSLMLNYFTNIGPVVVDTFQIIDTSANFFKLKYDLRNDGLTAAATTISSKLSTADTAHVTNITGALSFGNITPGQVKSTSSFFPHYIYTKNNPSSIDFTVNIFSNGHFFWKDSFTVYLTPVGIAEDEPNLPTEYALKQNYPNPFNPSTKIKYSIPNRSKVILKVFDVLGKEIETLLNEEKPAGSYEINWNASKLSSGVYFYQLKTGGFFDTKKMILLR